VNLAERAGRWSAWKSIRLCTNDRGSPAHQDHVSLLHGDALKNKNELNRDLLRAVADMGRRFGTKQVKLVSKSALRGRRAGHDELAPDRPSGGAHGSDGAVEIAERLTATVWTEGVCGPGGAGAELGRGGNRAQTAAEGLLPRPEVDSAFVRIRPNATKRARVGDVVRWRNFLRDLYVHRRKNLRGALVGSRPGVLARRKWIRSCTNWELMGRFERRPWTSNIICGCARRSDNWQAAGGI